MALDVSIGCDEVVTLLGLYDSISQTFQNTATVNATLNNLAGSAVIGPVSLAYVAGTSGTYQGGFTATQTGGLSVGIYSLVVIATTSGGFTLEKVNDVSANYLS